MLGLLLLLMKMLPETIGTCVWSTLSGRVKAGGCLFVLRPTQTGINILNERKHHENMKYAKQEISKTLIPHGGEA